MLIGRALASGDTCSSAELGEPLLHVVGGHYRDDLHIGIQFLEKRLRERNHIGWVRHVEDHKRCPPPLRWAEVHRLRLPALRGSLDELADAPVPDRLATGPDRNRNLGHNSHDYPSPGCGCAGPPLPPCAWLGRVSSSCIDCEAGSREPFARQAHTWRQFTPGRTVWTALPLHWSSAHRSRVSVANIAAVALWPPAIIGFQAGQIPSWMRR